MNRRITGLLMAIAAIATSLIVLLQAEKPRRYLQARFEQARSVLPKPRQVRWSMLQMALRISRFANGAKGTAKRVINKVKGTGSDLAERAKQLTAVGNQNGR